MILRWSLRLSGLLLVVCASAFAGNAWHRLTPTEQVVMQEYVQTYCHPGTLSSDADKFRYIGAAGTLSRIVIHAGMGPQAYADYLKCKAQGAVK